MTTLNYHPTPPKVAPRSVKPTEPSSLKPASANPEMNEKGMSEKPTKEKGTSEKLAKQKMKANGNGAGRHRENPPVTIEILVFCILPPSQVCMQSHNFPYFTEGRWVCLERKEKMTKKGLHEY